MGIRLNRIALMVGNGAFRSFEIPPMPIHYRNRLEDRELLWSHIARETTFGRRIGLRNFWIAQAMYAFVSVLPGVLIWLTTTSWGGGIVISAFLALMIEAGFLVEHGRHPITSLAVQACKASDKWLTERDLREYALLTELIADEDGIEARTPESSHRWRWRRIERVFRSGEFLYIHVGMFPALQIPKRDFHTELDFLEFGAKLEDSRAEHQNESFIEA